MVTLKSARLRLTPAAAEDLPFFIALWQDPRVMRHLGGVRDIDRIAPLVSEGAAQWRTVGLGRWVMRLGPHPVGTVKLVPVTLRGRSEFEIGYALLPQHAAHGYASEATERVLAYAFEDRSMSSVVALVRDCNDRSVSVLKRLDFEREGWVEHPLGPHVLYRATRSRWLSRRSCELPRPSR